MKRPRVTWKAELLNSISENSEPKWVAGFMSGTSLDAVDAALILTDGEQVFDFGATAERKYTNEERAILQGATDAARAWNWTGEEPNVAFDAARRVITSTHQAAWGQLLSAWKGPQPVLAGVHGQTVLHRAPKADVKGVTLQLIDAPSMRAVLGVPLAFDFRSDDVAAGGQGAPLAPAYHVALLDRLGDEAACVLNLGGVANITARMSDGALVAFDTGPANGPIDEWVEGHGLGTHDVGGRLAAAGRAHEGLLMQLLDQDWFDQAPPKSLDRYDFNASMVRGLSVEDGAATLTAFTARAVARALALLPEYPARMIVCGGGRHNPVLMEALAGATNCDVLAAESVGWRGDSIEAEAFAFLAARTARSLPISWPSTTGVPAPMGGGKLLA